MDPSRLQPHEQGGPGPSSVTSKPRKRKNHRAGKKKKPRRKSLAVVPDDTAPDGMPSEGLDGDGTGFYLAGRNLSNTSMESETVLDHRAQDPFIRPRRPSMLASTSSFQNQYPAAPSASRSRFVTNDDSDEEDDEGSAHEDAPLLSSSVFRKAETFGGYGANDTSRRSGPASRRSSRSSNKRNFLTRLSEQASYGVNYPPSVPGSPRLHHSDVINVNFGDAMLRNELDTKQSSPMRSIDDGDSLGGPGSERRHTITLQIEEDGCFPQDRRSEMDEDELNERDPATASRMRAKRRRAKRPKLAILDDWSRIEREGRSEEGRVKKITEPKLVNGRLRPVHKGWFRAEEEAPYRFTYFNEDFQSTIHSQTISELVQPGSSFKELFKPEPRLLSDSSDDENSEDDDPGHNGALHHVLSGQNGDSKVPSRQPSLANTTQQTDFGSGRERPMSSQKESRESVSSKPGSGDPTPAPVISPEPSKSPQLSKTAEEPKFGDRPVWWLDIYSPTQDEMNVISKAFGIHSLTAEDIMVQEQREKVELFDHYYFVNYRTFEQDPHSDNYLDPVNMYVLVFQEGVLSFHFSVTPHPANVRRRVRQLRDFLLISPDFIAYAIIDDVTDALGPLIQGVEREAHDIDDAILQLHDSDDPKDEKGRDIANSDSGEINSAEAGRNMLRRVGDCRKRVTMLYNLLGTKKDVIKGFVKRCHEGNKVAPRSEMRWYYGDIQDHILTMTSNLTHYEKILARSDANYLALINIRMNERQEQTADVLGKLTVLGTIVLPMNIITGLWGMNVWVPGQGDEESLNWFFAITAGLLIFGVVCYLIAKRVYKIV